MNLVRGRESVGFCIYIHKAKLEFYIEHGSNEFVKKEYQLMLKDKNTTLRDFKAIADGVMPEVTTRRAERRRKPQRRTRTANAHL